MQIGNPRGGLDQVLLYGPGHSPRAISLPGELIAVRFAPTGTWFVAIWTDRQGNDATGHAGLINPSTGKVDDLEPALGAVWLTASSAWWVSQVP